VRGGTCFITKTLALTAEDGGLGGAPVVYRAYAGEKPVLIGGRIVGSFSAYRGQIRKADVGSQGLRGVAFRQLYFNGQRQPLARYPNFNPQHHVSGGWA